MEIVHKKGNATPLKALIDTTLNEKVLELSEWLCALLAVKPDEKNIQRLEVLLPMVKEYCWSMSINDIQRAFIKYAKGELPGLEPTDNYLTTILFGKVIKAYKSELPVKPLELKQPELTQQQKDEITAQGALRCYNEYKELGMVLPGQSHIYDYLKEKGFIRISRAIFDDLHLQAKINVKKAAQPTIDRQGRTIDLNKPKESEIVSETKRLILEHYFEKRLRHDSEKK